ncbi:hypothetical protein CPB86DRAFT_373132 [Serendipita vermifera]|nr:hypothetical protein CPB86DRAFT_373132 [Serendipita vermifera]
MGCLVPVGMSFLNVPADPQNLPLETLRPPPRVCVGSAPTPMKYIAAGVMVLAVCGATIMGLYEQKRANDARKTLLESQERLTMLESIEPETHDLPNKLQFVKRELDLIWDIFGLLQKDCRELRRIISDFTGPDPMPEILYGNVIDEVIWGYANLVLALEKYASGIRKATPRE